MVFLLSADAEWNFIKDPNDSEKMSSVRSVEFPRFFRSHQLGPRT